MASKRDPWGIEASYQDAFGTLQETDADTIALLRERIGVPPERAATLVLEAGQTPAVAAGVLALEDGTEQAVRGQLPADLPLGYHTLHSDGGAQAIIVCPPTCYLPTGWRAWGLATQLYAARSRHSWGMGDLADLRGLADWSAERGAEMLLVNPLCAAAPTVPQQASPYFPTTRRFLSPLYLRIEELPGAEAADLEALAAAGRGLNERSELDRDAVWRLKLGALGRIWRLQSERLAEEPSQALREYGIYCALAEQHGPSWRAWPSELRHPSSPAVARFAADAADRVGFWCWVQSLCRNQLEAASRRLRVITDLPIGFDPDGLDAWAFQDVLAEDVAVGAPPDMFNTQGQNWGLPPLVPWKLAHAGYRPFVDSIRAALAHGGGLRIDHVMGLYRLWWIPSGAGAARGAYVRYPASDLLRIIALESHRARAVVVGEDLGTVVEEFREELLRRKLLSYRLLWFEDSDPKQWPPAAMAAITTHDLPTVAGLWSGADLEEQRSLGLQPNVEGTDEIRARLAKELPPGEAASTDDAVLAAHRALARAPSVLLCATLEDLLGLERRPNIPGADAERANWSIPLPVRLEELDQQPIAGKVAEILARAVAASASDPDH